MDPNDLLRFARRPWAEAERHKQEYWADRFAQEGPGPARLASTVLLEHARRIDADFPTAAHRDDDLAHHVEIRDRLDRAARALTGR